jgi:hypothetical protein
MVPGIFRVVDASARPIADALISWTPARPEWLTATTAETSRPWEDIQAGSLFASTDADGVCALQIDKTMRAVVWVSRPGYVSNVVHNLRGGLLELPEAVVLQSSTAMIATVVLEDSTPASGAEIRQCVSMWDKPADSRSVDQVVLRLFQRVYSTDDQGRSSLAGITGYLSLGASREGLVSNQWTGIQPCDPVLTLRRTYTASGSVPPHPAGLADDTRDRIVITATVENAGEEIGYVTTREDGSWGPVLLPCRPASEYLYHLESDVWLAQLVRRPTPAPGQVVRVEFPGEKGLSLPVITVDKAGAPIEGVRVMLSSEVKDRTVMSTVFTDAKGEAVLRTVRPGGNWIATRKTGYEPTLTDRFELYEDSPVPYRAELSAGGNVRGRVVMDGKPVRSFAIRMWNVEKNFQDERHFLDRTDGVFEIPDLPLGELSLVGTSLTTARSRPVTALIEAGSSAEVSIELADAIVGRGHVISAATGDPVPGALVQPFLVVPGRNFGPFGPLHPCSSDGAFEIVGFGPDRNLVEVTAPGFASLRQFQIREERGLIDFGWIALQKAGDLSVQLNTDLNEAIERFSVGLLPSDRIPEVRMSGSGSARFEGISPAKYEASVWMGGLRAIQTLVEVRPGHAATWNIEHKQVRDLVAELVLEPGEVMPPGLVCRASYIDAAGLDVSYCAPFDEKRRVDFSRIPQDNLVLDVFNPDWKMVATQWVSSSRQKPQVVRLSLGKPPVHVRIVDPRDAPVFPAQVLFKQWKNGMSWSLQLPTDDQGELEIPRVSEMSATAIVISPTRRKWVQELIAPTASDDVVEIVVANDSFVEVRAIDHSSPLTGLQLDLIDPLGLDVVFESSASNPDGRVRFDHLDQQDFEVRSVGIGYWPTKARVTPTPDGAQLDMQVRRLGGAHLHASIMGTPYRRKPISLRSVEFDTDVAEWLAAGRVQAGSSKLETDDDGRLAVDGLPNGAYRWSAKNSSGEWTSGEFTVPPRATASVSVTLP